MRCDDAVRAVGPLVLGAIDALEPTAETIELIEGGGLGGVTLFRRNVDDDVEALARRNAALHARAPRPFIVAVDQEGGRVARLRTAPVTQLPAARDLAEWLGEKTIERLGFEVARQLRALGFTMNFAPVLDVHSEPANPVIGDRAFGVDHASATSKALAFASGQRRAGLASCGKHFPGHGDTTTDSHHALPYVDAARAVLEARELPPFRAAAAAGLEAMMSAHVVYRALADGPATLAPAIVTELLRRELGFEGVLFSDDLRMKALSSDVGANAIAAIAAGCDVALVCEGEALVREVVEALAAEYRTSEAFRARAHASAARVARLTAAFPAAPIVDRDVLRAELEASNTAAVRVMAGIEP